MAVSKMARVRQWILSLSALAHFFAFFQAVEFLKEMLAGGGDKPT